MAHYRPALCIVDVLVCYLSADAHKDQAVRTAPSPLAEAAEANKCTIILIRHLNKQSGGTALYRGGGSIGIVGAARAAFLIGRDPTDPDRRVQAVTKTNLALEPPALAYRLVSVPKLGCARVEWEPEPLEGITAASLIREPLDDVERHVAGTAESWLFDYLADHEGEAATADLKRACHAAGLEWNSVRKHLPKLAEPFRTGFGAAFTAGWRLKHLRKCRSTQSDQSDHVTKSRSDWSNCPHQHKRRQAACRRQQNDLNQARLVRSFSSRQPRTLCESRFQACRSRGRRPCRLGTTDAG